MLGLPPFLFVCPLSAPSLTPPTISNRTHRCDQRTKYMAQQQDLSFRTLEVMENYLSISLLAPIPGVLGSAVTKGHGNSPNTHACQLHPSLVSAWCVW